MASTASTAETLGEIFNEYDALDEADREAYREPAIEELHNHEPSYWKLRLGGMLVTLVSPQAYVTMDVGWLGYPRIHWMPSGCSLEVVFEGAFPSWRNGKTFLFRCILLFYILLR